MPIIPRRYRDRRRRQPFRIGPRALLIVGFAGLVLVALSGAFLIGLAVVGLLAARGWRLSSWSAGISGAPSRRSARSTSRW